MLLHLLLPKIVKHSQHLTLWQQLTPTTRVLCVLTMVLAITLTPNGRWMSWGVYGIFVLILLLVSRVSLLELLQRVIVEIAFVGVILLGTLFRQEGTPIWSWGIIQITDIGVMILLSVSIKVSLCLLILNILVLTTPMASLLQALLNLKTPPLLVAIMSSMYRYIYVLRREFTTMQRAAASRNLFLSPDTTRRVIGNMIGVLFIRTYERGELVYQAMLARGYHGLVSRNEPMLYKKRDVWSLIFTGVTVVFGQVI